MTLLSSNFYLHEVEAALPRLLASFDRNPVSTSRGLGDRRYWAWKTQDFPNATLQGSVHGLARLIAADLLPAGMSRRSLLDLADDAVLATRAITARDGSLAEAFPTEKSFCVTALVAYDILSAADLLGSRLAPDRLQAWQETVAPLIDFVCCNDETHAVISNHLATAVAALLRWNGPGSAQARKRAENLLDIILDNQSSEGWFSEYGGADPGYETLGLTYLADAHLRDPELNLAEPLGRSLEFLQNFAHPDGSFGGGYGSRNTRFLVPGGLEALSGEFPVAAALSAFARRSIAGRRVVTLSAIDEPNLAPHFNAYCWAAAAFSAQKITAEPPRLPFESAEPLRRQFPMAGLLVDSTSQRYTIVSISKGGYVASFDKPDGRALIDAGVVGHAKGRLYSTQVMRSDNSWSLHDNTLTVETSFAAVVTERPNALQFAVLRALSLTLFHWRPFTEWVKRLIVRRLITGQRYLPVTNRRQIGLGETLTIIDAQSPDRVIRIDKPNRAFGVIHMASSGYWQAQDDEA